MVAVRIVRATQAKILAVFILMEPTVGGGVSVLLCGIANLYGTANRAHFRSKMGVPRAKRRAENRFFQRFMVSAVKSARMNQPPG